MIYKAELKLNAPKNISKVEQAIQMQNNLLRKCDKKELFGSKDHH